MSDFQNSPFWKEIDPIEFSERAQRHAEALELTLAGYTLDDGTHVDTVVKVDFQRIIIDGDRFTTSPEWFSAVLLGLEDTESEPVMIVGDVDAFLFAESDDPEYLSILKGFKILSKKGN